MNFTSIGDLAQSLQTRRQSTTIKVDLDTYAQELATGKHADIGRELNGNMRILAGITSSIEALNSFQRVASHAARHLQDTQSALEVVQSSAEQAASDLLLMTNVQDVTLLDNASNDANSKLSTVIGALNSQSAGQSIFSGADTDKNALQNSGDFVQAFTANVSGLTSVSDVLAEVENWFSAPGGGFETVSYLGSNTSLGSLKLNEIQEADVSVSALDDEIKQTLKGLLVASLVELDIPSGAYSDKRQLIEYATETLFSNASDLSGLRGRVGTEQARVEEAQSTNQSQISTLEIGHNELVLVDPFETATQLENTRNQLETLYSVTARLSQLKLADFLR